ncbi:MAG: hypothetical protein LBC56_07000 [Oscillospiraceae bacterium]|jgi:hypothetical protein|nr:hypothetical protein [Oscillospiraceae bacterium]
MPEYIVNMFWDNEAVVFRLFPFGEAFAGGITAAEYGKKAAMTFGTA